jgi:hypothetical protein
MLYILLQRHIAAFAKKIALSLSSALEFLLFLGSTAALQGFDGTG